ncbi:hypothetical protein KY329_01245 [Candidatus Woesearchaeota archaeon]|nr:hypothetical protein [Candidatus Woesearchaeota archaeon]
MNSTIILLGLLTVVFNVIGAILLKKAAMKFSWRRPINSYLVLSGCAYLVSVVPFTIALHETDLSFLYPFTALQYFGASLAGFLLYKEKFTVKKVGGILILLIGIILIGIGK